MDPLNAPSGSEDHTPTDDDLSPEMPDEQDTGVEDTPGREAQRQRARRREAEEARDAAVADRDALAGRLAQLQRTEAERQAAQVLADGSDLFTLGQVQLDDLLTDSGDLDPAAVKDAAEAIVEARGQRFARSVRTGADFDGGARTRPTAPPLALADVIRRQVQAVPR